MTNRRKTHSVRGAPNQRRKRTFRLTWRFALTEGLACVVLLAVLIWYLAYLAIEGDSIWHRIFVALIVFSMIEVTRAYLRDRR